MINISWSVGLPVRYVCIYLSGSFRYAYLGGEADWFLGRERLLVEGDANSRVNSGLSADSSSWHGQLFTPQPWDDRQLDIRQAAQSHLHQLAVLRVHHQPRGRNTQTSHTHRNGPAVHIPSNISVILKYLSCNYFPLKSFTSQPTWSHTWHFGQSTVLLSPQQV